MGIENMRRWPMYIVFAVCIMLLLSLFNSWTLETELQNKIAEITSQLQGCSKQQSSCMAESLSLLEQRDSYVVKVTSLEKQKVRLSGDLEEYNNKVSIYESKVNHTLVDVDLCKTELQSLKNLKASQSATLETLRLEKDTLTTQLTERRQKIEDLEKEIEKLKLSLAAKSAPIPPIVRVTPEAPIPKLNPVINPPVVNQRMLENAAKEEMGESNAINDENEFDPGMQ